MEITKLYQEGGVYVRYDFDDGRMIVEKSDPRVVHDALANVAAGTSVTINFQIVDFDGALRTDSSGTLLLDIEGVEVPVIVTTGSAQLPIELFASATVSLLPPFILDARMEPFRIEVAQ